MTKPKKPTLNLREQFNTWWISNHQFTGDGWRDSIFEWFEPHLRKQPAKPKIEIPEDKLIEFNNLWPEFKLPTGQYGRCSLSELNSAFQALFKTYPDYANDWDTIMEAGRIYVAERQMENLEYCRRAKYLVRRELKDKSTEHLLADYYQRIKNGTQEMPEDREMPEGFGPKII